MIRQTPLLLSLFLGAILAIPSVAAAQGTGRSAAPVTKGPAGTGRTAVPGGRPEGAVEAGAGAAARPVDRALDEALDQEFGKSGRREDPQPEPLRVPPPRITQVTIVAEEDEPAPEDWFHLRLGFAQWFVGLDEFNVRNSAFASDETDLTKLKLLDSRGRLAKDQDEEGQRSSQIYRLEIGLHPYVSITGFYHRSVLRGNRLLSQDLFYDDQVYDAGATLKTKIDLTITEIAGTVHAIRASWIRVDFHLGLRYMKVVTQLAEQGIPSSVRDDRLEGAAPMVGVGVILRPLEGLEVYGTLKAGGLDYEKNNSDDPYQEDVRSFSFASLDVGVRLNIKNTFGIGVGLRAESFELYRQQNRFNKLSFDGSYGGPYAAVFIGF